MQRHHPDVCARRIFYFFKIKIAFLTVPNFVGQYTILHFLFLHNLPQNLISIVWIIPGKTQAYFQISALFCSKETNGQARHC